MPRSMLYLSVITGFAWLVSSGCSPRVEGRKKAKKGAVLTYGEERLPGVRHSARTGTGGPVKDKGVHASSDRRSAPRVCDEESLADAARKDLDSLLSEARVGGSPKLPPPRAPHMSGTGQGRYLAALGQKKPGLARKTQSLRALRKIRIRYSPQHDAEEVGVLARNSRIPTYGFVSRRGCSAGWMALGPYAYVCSTRLRADNRPPELLQYPQVRKNRITPGVYGYIRRGGAPAYASRSDAAKKVMTRRLPGGFFIRFGRFTRVGTQNFWKTTKGLYVPISHIARHVPSKFHGYELAQDGLKLPLAIVRFKGPGKRGVPVFHAPGSRRVVGTLKRYTAVSVLGTRVVKGKWKRPVRYWRVGRCQWIRARATRMAHREATPPGIRQGERWIDVDLANQTLVAYEGDKPVFATLISAGKKKHETRHGVFRVYWKISEVDMANETGANEEYLAESVPWSMFFWKGQALHGAYWHDDFGRVKSHGCVNLSPMDARYLFEWTQPDLPRGWRHAWHGERFPGPALRIRRRLGERPRLLGLARKFAPAAAVAARDQAYKERIRVETLKMYGGKADDDAGAQKSKPAVASSASKPTAAGALMPARRVRKSVVRRVQRVRSVRRENRARKPVRRKPVRRKPVRRKPRGGGGLVPIKAPSPPPPGRRQ
jgi:lipoprotein-anchoring transpeptidase ErfK/SrfK